MKWIDRDEALAELGVKPQTLYAYVSRGLITSRPDTDDPRASLYASSDIAALVRRRRSGRSRNAIANAAIAWGDPVMDTAITTVRNGRLIYRGKDAVRLAEKASLEEIASLLWNSPSLSLPQSVERPPTGVCGKTRALSYLSGHAAADAPIIGASPDTLAQQGNSLLQGFCAAITQSQRPGSFHQKLARHWKLDPGGIDLIRRALVLVADHELNPSTFAARVAASTGAPLAACALAGCATLTGPLHGEASARAIRYLQRARMGGPQRALNDLVASGERIPATGHILYPEGDPRARALLRWLNPSADLKQAISLAEEKAGVRANIDMALAALTLQLKLPEDAPFLIFASGRMAGWIAHAIEQSASNRPIRPRANYTEPRIRSAP